MKVAIIGAGLGGLTAGALLAKDGFDITILEQHNIVGGCATTFKRGDFICEVGLHEMDNIYNDKIKKEIFTKLKVYENIEFVKPNEFFRIKTDNIDFTMPCDVDKAIEKLTKKYPKHGKEISNYFTLIKSIYIEFEKLNKLKWYEYLLFPIKYKNILRYKNKSVSDVFDEIFSNEELKIILNANIGYYHDNPKELSFLLHSIAQYSFFSGGGWYIKGGSYNLSRYLANIILQNKGKVLTKANVVKIEKNKLFYKHKKELKKLNFDLVVSNISPSQTYKMANISYKETKEFGISLLTIYIGFNKNLKSIYGKRAYSTFFFKNIKNLNELNMKKSSLFDRGFVFTDYSQIESNLTKEDKSFGVIVTADYLKDWENLSKKAYKAKKEKIKEIFLKELETEYKNIKNYIEYCEVATAKTIKRYIKTPNGTPYGYAPTSKQFFKIPQTKSKKMNNLYFTGQWILGGGFSPSIRSGYLTYKNILTINSNH